MPGAQVLLDRAKALVENICKEKRVSAVIKDVSWLWRTAYNCATQGCTEWDNAEERVPPLFDVSREVRLPLYPGSRWAPSAWEPSCWSATLKRRLRWMRKCICVSCFRPSPPPRLEVCVPIQLPELLHSYRLVVFAMRKLEPQMVNSDKVWCSPLYPPRVSLICLCNSA